MSFSIWHLLVAIVLFLIFYKLCKLNIILIKKLIKADISTTSKILIVTLFPVGVVGLFDLVELHTNGSNIEIWEIITISFARFIILLILIISAIMLYKLIKLK